MKKLSACLLLLLAPVLTSLAQKKILPGDPSIDQRFLKDASYAMSYSINYQGQWLELGTYETQLSNDNNIIKVKAELLFHKNGNRWTDLFTANAGTLSPLHTVSENDDRKLSIDYSGDVSGESQNKKSQKRTAIHQSFKEKYFDIAFYPYLLKTLPLELGYRATIPVFDHQAEDMSKIYNVIIKEVKSDLYISDLTGEHKVWKVSVFEESTGHNYDFFMDKVTHRTWKINILSKKGDRITLVEKETDFNPFKNTFDKTATLSMIRDGSATIAGVAFARDNENEGLLKGMAVLNVNKKQYAPKGTTITLIPYTAYFKEWIELNKKQEKVKNAKAIPLLRDAYDCIKTAEVYNDEGNFEFTNLKPGSYLLITSFGYTHHYYRTEETGRASVYVNGAYQGDRIYTDVFGYSRNASANVQKVVDITEAGAVLKVKLKKTL